MVFIIVIVAIIIVFIVLGTLIEGDPSDSKTVKYERPKTKPIFSEKVNIDRKERYPSEIGRLYQSVFGCELCNQKRYV